MTKCEYMNKLLSMMHDINPSEIASHIQTDTLNSWCNRWKEEMVRSIFQLETIDRDSFDRNITNEEIYQGYIHLEAENERLHDEIEKLRTGEWIKSFEGMTNGEVMQAVFPKAEVGIYIDEYERPYEYLMHIDDGTYFTKEWWNAPYKGGAE